MADQVNPLGSLTAGVLQTLQVASKPPSASPPESSSAQKAVRPQTKNPGERRLDVSSGSLDEAAEQIKDYLKNTQSNLQFLVDKGTGLIVFKVINSSTKEVIRQVPAEEVLAMARKLRELTHDSDASGVLMDEKG